MLYATVNVEFPMSEHAQEQIKNAKRAHENHQETLPEEDRKPFRITQVYELGAVERELNSTFHEAKAQLIGSMPGWKYNGISVVIGEDSFQYQQMFSK